jgi:hypothetical protein
MTVKIIKMEPDPQVVRQTVCFNCGVTLEYVPNDIKNRVHRDYTGDSDTVYYIDCAACNQQVRVSR